MVDHLPAPTFERFVRSQYPEVVRLVDYNRNRTRYGPLDFSLDEQGMLTCPNDQTSSRAYRSSGGDGWNYRFLAAQCEGCPLLQKCRGDAVKPGSYRQIFVPSTGSGQAAPINHSSGLPSPI